jgi:hypothetical protein
LESPTTLLTFPVPVAAAAPREVTLGGSDQLVVFDDFSPKALTIQESGSATTTAGAVTVEPEVLTTALAEAVTRLSRTELR